MAYKWKPNASQRAAFREKMQDPIEKASYEERKRLKHTYEGFKDKSFIPTLNQYNVANEMLLKEISKEQEEACHIIFNSYVCQDKCHHDYIHIINEFSRNK